MFATVEVLIERLGDDSFAEGGMEGLKPIPQRAWRHHDNPSADRSRFGIDDPVQRDSMLARAVITAIIASATADDLADDDDVEDVEDADATVRTTMTLRTERWMTQLLRLVTNGIL